MKKIFLGFIAIAIAFTSIAQRQDKVADKNAKTHKKEYRSKGTFAKDLNLTPQQKTQMQVLNKDFKKQMQALNTSNNTADIKQRRQALAKDHQQKLNNILTPEQRLQAEQFKKKHSNAKGDHHRAGIAQKGKDDKLEKLNLSRDQQAKAKALNESFKNKQQEVESNTSLSQEQKKEQLKTLRQQHKEEIQSMLTTEQKENLKIRVKNRPGRKAVK